MSILQNIETLISDNDIAGAFKLVDEFLGKNPDDAEGLFLRGKLFWKVGNRSRAMSDYAAAAAIDPHSPAVQALEHAHDIENFFNPDLLNP